MFQILINIPGLTELIALGNRYLDYVEGKQQAQIDALTAKVVAMTTGQAKADTALETAIKENT